MILQGNADANVEPSVDRIAPANLHPLHILCISKAGSIQNRLIRICLVEVFLFKSGQNWHNSDSNPQPPAFDF